MKQLLYISIISFIWFNTFQNVESENIYLQVQQEELTIKGTVRTKKSFSPIADVAVMVNAGFYTTTDREGNFTIKAKKGDELMLRHESFETVFYTIQSNDRIIIEVEDHVEERNPTQIATVQAHQNFRNLIDSVNSYRKKNIEKSINFISEALKVSSTQAQNAEVYETLADVYNHWKQYDLAIANYRISLQNQNSNRVRLKLAKSFELNEDFDESLANYKLINEQKLSNYNRVVYYEGIGDTYAMLGRFKEALENYKIALEIAEENSIETKKADLSSKAGQTFAVTGETDQAEQSFSNALKFAEEVNPKRVAEEKVNIADFRSTSKNYKAEIDIRKDILDDVEKIENRDSIIPNESPLTPQKQNYKIGNALYLSNETEEAINYFEKSIVEAEIREDLVVKKDALRKVSEAYERSGDYEKAKQTFEKYIQTVDELYKKREQEISQAARLSQKIVENQSRITSLEMDRQLSESVYQLSEEKSKRQQTVIYALIAGLILVLVLLYVLFKYLKQQRLNNNLLALKSLRSQMNPHFIFNALNSVNSFIATNDERTANKYLTDFSLLMREVLENSEENFIPLEKEIDLLKIYTKLEHFRFSDKFDYYIELDEDIDLKNYTIPPMLLQPYIENAVWHGLRYRESKGFLRITLNNLDENLINIKIEDNGIGRHKSKELKTQNQDKHNSKGLSNIKKRVEILNRMYKDKIAIDIKDLDSEAKTGTVVSVRLRK